MRVPWGMPKGFAILIFGSNLNLCHLDSVILSWDITQNRMNNYYIPYVHSRGSQRATVVKKKKKKPCLPTQKTSEMWVPPLAREEPLEEGMAIHSSGLENPIDRGAWRAAVHRATQSDMTEVT